MEGWLVGDVNRDTVGRRGHTVDARAANELGASTHGFVRQTSV